MIRVLQFADVVNRYDFIDTIVQHANPQRFEVGVCVRSLASNIAAPVYRPQTPRWHLEGRSPCDMPRAVYQLARLLRRWKVDILHTHHYHQAVIGWLATRLSPRTRLVVGRHYSDAIYRSSDGLKRKLLLGVEQAVNRAATRVVVPSAYISQILTQWQSVNEAKVDRVPYGFTAEKYADPPPADVRRVRAEFGMDGRCFIGNFSRLHEEKGQRFLIQAMAQLRQSLPDLTLLIVGEGPERAALEKQIRDCRLHGVVHLLGWRRDAMVLMAAVDAVVQPTLQEAFSQVMIEALWMRKPLIITDVSGAPDVIRDRQNGLLIPKGDANALASAIQRLVVDEPLRKQLAAAGRTFVEQHLTIDKIIPRYEQVYLRAMES